MPTRPAGAGMVIPPRPDKGTPMPLPTDDVLEAQADTIFTQAENRLHTQKAVLVWLKP